MIFTIPGGQGDSSDQPEDPASHFAAHLCKLRHWNCRRLWTGWNDDGDDNTGGDDDDDGDDDDADGDDDDDDADGYENLISLWQRMILICSSGL